MLHRDAVAKNIKEFNFNEMPNAWNSVTNDAKVFLSSLLNNDPTVSHKKALFNEYVSFF